MSNLPIISKIRSLWFASTDALEFFLAVTSLSVGIHFLLPGSTVELGGGVFRIMGSVAPDIVWGALLVLSGVGKFAYILFDSRLFYRFALLLSVIVWLFMAISALFSNRYGIAFTLFSVIAAGNCWLYMRRVGEVRHV